MTTCTVAAIISFLGYMPPAGTVISVPKSETKQYTRLQIAAAKVCAARYKIKWQIVNDGAGQ